MKAWVIFHPDCDWWLTKILKRGYRHCSVAIWDGQTIAFLDPLAGYLDLVLYRDMTPFEFCKFYSDKGFEVVETRAYRRNTPAPFAIFSCVEIIKRALGIHSMFVQTPWQLRNHLKRMAL